MDNLRGMALMSLGMAGTASVDAVIKSLSTAVAPPQIIIVVSFGGAIIFGTATVRGARRLFRRRFASGHDPSARTVAAL